jgi:hypothetical protein
VVFEVNRKKSVFETELTLSDNVTYMKTFNVASSAEVTGG